MFLHLKLYELIPAERTLTKYRFRSPLARRVMILAVFVQADFPQAIASMTFVPSGISLATHNVLAIR